MISLSLIFDWKHIKLTIFYLNFISLHLLDHQCKTPNKMATLQMNVDVTIDD